MKYVIFDTETSDLKGEVIQLSFLVLNENLDIELFDSFYCNTTELITEGAYGVHGISNEMLEHLSEGKYLEDYLLTKYKDYFMGQSGLVFIGYNIPFDIQRVNYTLMNHTGLTMNAGNVCCNLMNLDPNRNYNFDIMRYCRSKFKMVKGLNLAKAVELTTQGYDVDKFYNHYAKQFNIDRRGSFHDASYDAFMTYLVLLALYSEIM